MFRQCFSDLDHVAFGVFVPYPILVAESTAGEFFPVLFEVPDWGVDGGLVGGMWHGDRFWGRIQLETHKRLDGYHMERGSAPARQAKGLNVMGLRGSGVNK